MPTKTIEQYIYTVTVYRDDDGNEVERFENPMSEYWYDTESTEELTDEELENELS